MPLPPGGVRAGGWISAGMISTVQTPLPIFAETAPRIWPHFCAPSPESDTISAVCSRARSTRGSPRRAPVAAGTATAADDGAELCPGRGGVESMGPPEMPASKSVERGG